MVRSVFSSNRTQQFSSRVPGSCAVGQWTMFRWARCQLFQLTYFRVLISRSRNRLLQKKNLSKVTFSSKRLIL